jgi:hypothetical protein
MTHQMSLSARTLLHLCYLPIYEKIWLAISREIHKKMSAIGNSQILISYLLEADHLVQHLAPRLPNIIAGHNIASVKVSGFVR